MPETPSHEDLEEKVRQLEGLLAAANARNRLAYKDQQFLKILIDTIPSPIFYKDKEGIYRHCNDAFSTDILGLDRSEIINRSLFDLPDVIPADLAQLYYEKDKGLFERPGTQTYKGEVRCSDGTRKTFKFFKSTILDESGEVEGLVGIMLDITNMEVKRSRLATENDELKSLSYIDSLTGVLNRRKFESLFPVLLESSGHTESFLNFALIDIDHFKPFNDNYGHPEGDKALKDVAHAIERNLKCPDDHAFRIGGEEFCVLFHSRNEADAVRIAENIRSGVEELAIPHAHNGGMGVLTVSVGLLSIQSPTIDKLQIYEETDKLLYKAKHTGRNRIRHKTL